MYFWYLLVSAVSIFDNLVAAPFTRSWTIRVSRKPTGILLDDTVPKITDRRGGRYANVLEALKAGPNTNQHIAVVGSRAQAPLGDSRFCANENLHVLSRVGEQPERIIASLCKKADIYRQSEPSQMLVRVASL